jgi:hypothetical protein
MLFRGGSTMTRRRWTLVGCALVPLFGAGAAPASSGARPQAPGQQPGAHDRFQKLAKDYQLAVKRWRDDVRAAAKESEEKEAEVRARHPVRTFWPLVEELGQSGHGPALAWMVEACEDHLEGRAAVVEKKSELVERLVRDHAGAEWAAEELVELLPRQRVWFDEEWVRAQLEALARGSQNKEVAAAAWYELAQRLTSPRASEDERKRGQEVLARIERELAGTQAASRIAQKKQAAVYDVGGKPEFEAVDVDGAAFRLSDYRGKVVMLDFWGFW